MSVVAKLRYLHIAPRKVRLVADLIRGKSVEEAQTILNFTLKKGAGRLLKLLKSAIANAKHNFQLDESNLYISKVFVDEGPKYKRWMPRARGSASEIQKKTSHITLVLDELSETKKIEKAKEAKKVKIEKVIDKPVEGEAETKERKEEVIKKEKPRYKPLSEMPKPKTGKGIRRFFQRKAF